MNWECETCILMINSSKKIPHSVLSSCFGIRKEKANKYKQKKMRRAHRNVVPIFHPISCHGCPCIGVCIATFGAGKSQGNAHLDPLVHNAQLLLDLFLRKEIDCIHKAPAKGCDPIMMTMIQSHPMKIHRPGPLGIAIAVKRLASDLLLALEDRIPFLLP